MDKTTKYQTAIVELFQKYETLWRDAWGLENRIIADTGRNNFVMLSFGWQNAETYTHLLCFHIEIKDDKVWIHENNTDVMIAVDLIEKGVSPEDIVLGFVEPYVPIYTHLLRQM